MRYSFSYHLPNEYSIEEHKQAHNYNSYMQVHGLKEIASMMHRDFKYHEYGIDNWSGGKQCRIELVVFSRKQWRSLLASVKTFLEPWQIKQLRETIFKLEHENKQADDADSNRV